MYVVTKNGRVLIGPNIWDKHYFQNLLYARTNLEYPLPYVPKDTVIHINDEVSVWPVKQVPKPSRNIRNEKYDGPFWEFDDNYAYESWQVVDKPMDLIKNQFKEYYATKRWEMETKGVNVTVGDETYKIDTSREGRNSIFNGTAGTWKLKLVTGVIEETGLDTTQDVWRDVNDATLQAFKEAVKNHVSDCFAWEKQKIEIVDSATIPADADNFEVIKDLNEFWDV